MCFPATWLSQDNITEITGYNSIHICRNNFGMSGEISIYAKDTYKTFLLNDISFVSDVIKI